MAQKNRTELKSLFGTGDKLSAASFIDLIDSLVNTKEDSIISGSLIPVAGNDLTSSFNLGSTTAAWKEIYVSTGSLNFVDTDGTITSLSKDDVLATKDFETRRKSTEGIPVKKVRGFTSASTFIDLEAINSQEGDRIDIKVANTFEAASFSTARTSIGPKETVPLELTGSLKIRPAHTGKHEFHGKYQFTGKHAAGNAVPIHDESAVAIEISGSLLQSSSGGIFEVKPQGTSFTNGNVVAEDLFHSQPGIINQSIKIGSPDRPSISKLVGVGDDNKIIISSGVNVSIFGGSRLIIQDQQPNIIANNETGDIIVTHPGKGSDIVFSVGSVGTNPTIIDNNINIPKGNLAKWYGPIKIGRTLNSKGEEIIINKGSLRINTNTHLKIQDF
jgi:hypothetical protein